MAHRNTDRRRRQRRRVVHAIAHHSCSAALRNQLADKADLLLGHQPRFHARDPDLLGNALRRRTVVARQHHDFATERAQRIDRLLGFVTRAIAHADRAERALAVHHRHRRHRPRLNLFGHPLQSRIASEVRVRREQRRPANASAHAVDHRLDALALHRDGILRLRNLDSARARRANHRTRNRMIRCALDAGGDTQEFLFADSRHQRDCRKFGPSSRDRARLVDGNPAQQPEILQMHAALHQHAATRRAREAGKNRGRRRDRQRTRRRADQHAHRAKERLVPILVKHQRRHHDRQRRRHQHAWNVDARELLRRTFSRRLRRLRFGNQPHHLRHQRFARQLRHSHNKRAVAVQRSREDSVAGLLVDRHAFARDRALINRRAPLGNHSVGGDPLARTHDDDIVDRHQLNRDLALGRVGHAQTRHLGRDLRQRRHCAASAAHR